MSTLAYFWREFIDELKWQFNLGCQHKNIHCIHGDEIILAGYRRSKCMDCPKLFDSLPKICTTTKQPHDFYKKVLK